MNLNRLIQDFDDSVQSLKEYVLTVEQPSELQDLKDTVDALEDELGAMEFERDALEDELVALEDERDALQYELEGLRGIHADDY